MKRLIWLFKYAWCMKRSSDMPWAYCWESACITLDDYFEGDLGENPTDAAIEEMSHWDPE